MRSITLKTITGKTLYEGFHHTHAEAVEAAHRQSLCLDGIDLAYTDLRHMTLDGVTLNNAVLTEADLTGANLSESVLTGCDFRGARMVDTCLCYSKINQCNFKYTSFGATDIAVCALDSCEFEGWSTFSLAFDTAQILTNLTFTHHKQTIPFSAPPIIIHSDVAHCAIFGNLLIYKEYANTFGNEDSPQKDRYSPPKEIQSLIDFVIKKIG